MREGKMEDRESVGEGSGEKGGGGARVREMARRVQW